MWKPRPMRRPIVLLHGYSASAASLERWKAILIERGYAAGDVHLAGYISLSNEISIKDLAEGFDRALRVQAGLSDGEEFDALVHSTGGLVLREWLATYDARRERVKHIIALAPAMFGSPLAHKGRSWLGAVFKGEREPGPDFLEAGTRVLSGLELGSSYTWQLAHRDLLGTEPTYGADADTPYPFVFIGTKGYDGLRGLFTNPDGSDGTVRWSAAGLTTRKLIVDMRAAPDIAERVRIVPWSNVDVPLVFVPGANHASILGKPPGELVDMVMDALAVEDHAAYVLWAERHAGETERRRGLGREHDWQQLVLHTVDERGDPVPDYFAMLGTVDDGAFVPLEDFAFDVHPYTDDTSYRCFHLDLTKLDPAGRRTLELRVIARSGTELIGYYGHASETFTPGGEEREDPGKWDARVDLTPWLREEQVKFFWPFTTTLVEIRLNREPMPPTGVNEVLKFVLPGLDATSTDQRPSPA